MRHPRHRGHARATPAPQRHGNEAEHGEGLIFGIHAVEAALANPKRNIAKLFLTENAERRLQEALSARHLAHERVLPRDLDRLLGPDTVHQGALVEAAAAAGADAGGTGPHRRPAADHRARPGDRPAQRRRHPALGGGVRCGGPGHDPAAQPAAWRRARQVCLRRARARAGRTGAEPRALDGRAEGAGRHPDRPRWRRDRSTGDAGLAGAHRAGARSRGQGPAPTHARHVAIGCAASPPTGRSPASTSRTRQPSRCTWPPCGD